jgi:predicted nucleotidyltransferase
VIPFAWKYEYRERGLFPCKLAGRLIQGAQMSREDQILTWIRQGLGQYRDELSGYKVVLFGSRARRTHRERSDFDIGVVGDEPLSLKTYYRISDFLESLPTLYRIDWVDLNRSLEKLRKNALENAVVLYG